MSDPEIRRRARLGELVANFCSVDLKWAAPLAGEKEPEYTQRALFPQFEDFVKRINEPKLRLFADGSVSRPLPIFLSDQRFYPDISLDLDGMRTVAIEVKYLPSSNYSGSLSKALGQGLIYASLGYQEAHVILVSTDGGKVLPVEEISVLNANSSNSLVHAHELASN